MDIVFSICVPKRFFLSLSYLWILIPLWKSGKTRSSGTFCFNFLKDQCLRLYSLIESIITTFKPQKVKNFSWIPVTWSTFNVPLLRESTAYSQLIIMSSIYLDSMRGCSVMISKIPFSRLTINRILYSWENLSPMTAPHIC